MTDRPLVGLNLDTLERDGAPEPLTVVVGGKPYRLRDPQEIDWETLTTIAWRPEQFIRHAVADEKKREEFVAAVGKLPGWKIGELAKVYTAHYGLPSGPEAFASPASSNGTAGLPSTT